VWGRKVKKPHHQYFTASSIPNDCCPRKRHVWGTKAKPLAAYLIAGGFAVSELGLFVLAITSQNIRLHSYVGASGITRPMDQRPPYGQKTQTQSRLPKGRGFLFWRLRESRYALPTRRSLTHFPPGVRQTPRCVG